MSLVPPPLVPPPKVQKLQAALGAKAKASPSYRFYALYDKVYREDILAHAYRCCKANDGAAGVDGQEFADIKAYGPERWLGELAEALRTKTYRSQAVRRQREKGSELFYMLIRQIVSGVLLLHLLVENAIFLATCHDVA